MRKIYFNYSLKNIPVPSRTSYKLQIIDNIESVIERMRWKAHFFLNDNEQKIKRKQNVELLNWNQNIIHAN